VDGEGKRFLKKRRVNLMETKTRNTDLRNGEIEEELAGILTAISVVSKRLAKKLLTIQTRELEAEEGEIPDER
jgi:hypothetical protein